MKITIGGKTLFNHSNGQNKYPLLGIGLAVAIIMLSPFTSLLLNYVAFVICVLRILVHNARVFAIDFCVLLPFSVLFQNQQGMALIVFVSLFAIVWLILRTGIRADIPLFFLFVLLIYLLTRMQTDVSRFLLCFSNMCLLCLVAPKQDSESSEQIAKAFCTSLMLASVYAVIFRSAYQLRSLLGNEVPAFWGSSIMRFNGLFEDPNYYMTLLVIGLTLLIRLKGLNRIRAFSFWVVGIAFIAFGVMTCSKTFFISLILLGCIYIVSQLWGRERLRVLLVALVALPIVGLLIYGDNSPFAVIFTRFTSGSSLSDITTGRTDIFALYFETITSDISTLLFGFGFGQTNLGRDTHNLFLEVTYYIGFVGLLLTICFFFSLYKGTKKHLSNEEKQLPINKYMTIFMMIVLYCTLHGMFSTVLYGGLFLGIISTMLTKKVED